MPIKMNARYDVDELGKYLWRLRLTLLRASGITYSGGEKYKSVNSFGHRI